MKLIKKKTFAILLIIFMIAGTFSVATGQGGTMHTSDGVLVGDPVYLPVVANRYLWQNLFGITLYSFSDAAGLDQAVEAGARWTRKDFVWSNIEPMEGIRNWDLSVEQELINATSVGVSPIMVIESTPEWALKSGFNCGAVNPEKLSALATFAYDLVKRYSVSPYNVQYWELWNEPDAAGVLGCWGDPNDATGYYGGGYYGEMLKVVYPKIKEADPSAQVLVGGLLLDCDPTLQNGKDCTSSKFLEGILKDGAGPYFDGVSFHAYDFYTGEGTYSNPNWNSSSSTTGPVTIAKANYLRSVLSSYGYSEKYLMNTETAVFWGDNTLDPPCRADETSQLKIEVTKVNYVVESYAVAIAEGLKANVWYSAFGVRCSGLLNTDLSPKDSYFAYQFARQKLGTAEIVRPINDYEGIIGFEYGIPERRLWVIWSLDGQAHTIPLPGLPVEVNRMGEDGHAQLEPNNTTLTIGESDFSPRFVEFTK